MSRFDQCLDVILREEGGLTDHPSDPGGRTNYGITQRTLDRARAVIPTLPARVDDLTLTHVGQVYMLFYWTPAHCTSLPPGIDLHVFDAAVQHDPKDAVRFLQRALGVKDDGDFGPRSRAALANVDDTAALAQEYAARRLAYYMTLDAIDQTFGLGWARRVLRVHARALSALHGDTP